MSIADLPYIHALGDGGPRSRSQVIVVHATDNTATAQAEASYASHRADQTSAHFYVDETSAYRALPVANIAYGCLWHGNQISVQLELCGPSNKLTDKTLRQAAPIVAELCQEYNIPPVKITAAQVAAGVKGICGHLDITAAFPTDHGDHTDPGAAFPWSTFIGYVNDGSDMSAEAEQKIRDMFAILTSCYDDTHKLVSLHVALDAVRQHAAQADTNVTTLLARPAGAATLSPADLQTVIDGVAGKLAVQLGGKLDAILARLNAAGQALDG